MRMQTVQVVKELRARAAQFTSAADLVESINHRASTGVVTQTVTFTPEKAKQRGKKKRHISAAGRARIAAAARARWAKVKATSKIKLMKRAA